MNAEMERLPSINRNNRRNVRGIRHACRAVNAMLHFCALGILTLAFCDSAPAQENLEVDQSIDNIEIFERIVLGRGLQADWASKRLELLIDPKINVRIIVDESSPQSKDKLRLLLEKTAKDLQKVANLVTGQYASSTITTEFARDMSGWCNDGSKFQLNDSSQSNTALILIGASVDECLRSPELRELFYGRTPTGDAGDPDMLHKTYVTCSSRIRSVFSDGDNSSVAPLPRTKTIVVAASLEGNLYDLQRLQHCLFDRGFSFLGFRGRLIYAPNFADTKEERFDSLRTVPYFPTLPSTNDLLMLAVAYHFLGNGADYSSAREDIRKKLAAMD